MSPSPARLKAARNIISSGGGKYDPAHEPTKVPWEVRRRKGGERAFEEDAAALSYLVNKNDLTRRSSYIRAGCRARIGHYSMIAVSSAGPPLALSRKGRIKRSDTCAEDTISCQVITELARHRSSKVDAVHQHAIACVPLPCDTHL